MCINKKVNINIFCGYKPYLRTYCFINYWITIESIIHIYSLIQDIYDSMYIKNFTSIKNKNNLQYINKYKYYLIN